MRWLVAVATLGLLTLASATAYATPAAPDVSTLPTVPDEGFRDSVGNLFVVATSNGGFLPGAAGIGGTDAFILRNPQLLFAQ